MYVGSDSLQSLIMARRLLLLTREIEKHRKDPTAETKSFKEIIDEDEVQLSGGLESRATTSPSAKPATQTDMNVDIKFSDLIKQLKTVRDQSPTDSGGNVSEKVTITQSSSSTLEMEWKSYEFVDGLVVRNKHLAETNLYSFEFIDGVTFKITDKSTGKSTTIWGDPHVDTSDQEGNRNGEFSDLKSSNTHTTLKLRDGTSVTFTARDDGVIEAVDIIKENQQVHGTGAADKQFSEENSLFETELRTTSASLRPTLGDVVYAGGDGNDWFDEAHRLIWGITTGPLAGNSPISYMQVRYSEQFKHTVTIENINRTI